MFNSKKIAVIIPAFKCRRHIQQVLVTLPEFIDLILLIDDACPEETGEFAASLNIDKLRVIRQEKNGGVGAAVVRGYYEALSLGADIFVKMDGDGQMDPDMIGKLLTPIISGAADYAKGNRFRNFRALKKMPRTRLIGNSILSFLTKISSGYWDLMDPTNGFTAITKEAASELNLENISPRYFFESDMLINLNIQSQVVADVSIPSRYGDEKSNLRVRRVAFQFPFYIVCGLLKRIFFKYFIYDFNMGSIYLLVAPVLLLWGIGFGAISWYHNSMAGVTTSTGTVMLSVLPLILGTQFLLELIHIDIRSVPQRSK